MSRAGQSIATEHDPHEAPPARDRLSSNGAAPTVSAPSGAAEDEPLTARGVTGFEALLQIGRELTAQRDLDTLWHLILRSACDLLDADRSTLFLVDNGTDEIYTKIMEGNAFLEIRRKRGQGIAGIVAVTGETVNIPDVYQDGRWTGQELDRQSGYRTRSLLTMPLVNRHQQIIGVIQVLNRRHRGFDRTAEEMLAAMCSFAAVALENAQLYERLRRTFDSFVHAMTVAIDSRDKSTAGHSERVTAYSLLIGAEMGLSVAEMDLLRQTAILHDIGKIGVREAILTKPGKLTKDEYVAIQKHVEESERILQNVEFMPGLETTPLCAGQHHEKMNGTGYPRGIAGDAISLTARVIHVADVFDALTYKRYYHAGRPPEEVRDIIVGDAGPDFDPRVVEAFVRAWPLIEARCREYVARPDML